MSASSYQLPNAITRPVFAFGFAGGGSLARITARIFSPSQRQPHYALANLAGGLTHRLTRPFLTLASEWARAKALEGCE